MSPQLQKKVLGKQNRLMLSDIELTNGRFLMRTDVLLMSLFDAIGDHGNSSFSVSKLAADLEKTSHFPEKHQYFTPHLFNTLKSTKIIKEKPSDSVAQQNNISRDINHCGSYADGHNTRHKFISNISQVYSVHVHSLKSEPTPMHFSFRVELKKPTHNQSSDTRQNHNPFFQLSLSFRYNSSILSIRKSLHRDQTAFSSLNLELKQIQINFTTKGNVKIVGGFP